MNIKLAFAGVALLLSLVACAGTTPPAPPPPQVEVATPLVRQLVDWDEYVGRFEAVQSVQVKSRVTGYLQAVGFHDGQFVQRGQVLFVIDSRASQAALDQARAQLARAEATLINARTELARSQTLARSQAASTEEVEQRQAAVRAGQADVAAAQATVRAQALTVGFTRVLSPISGRISSRQVDVGNSVTADQTVLTTVVSIDPIHFGFEGSEALLLKYLRQNSGATSGTAVRIRLQDESEFAHQGTLDFVDNAVNTGAGTIRGRAIVANPGGFLRPGMFGTMQLAGSRPYAALLVPDTAVVTDAARKLLYVVATNGTVVSRPVVLGPLNAGLRVVRRGLNASDRVVVGGIQRAIPGQRVQARPGRIIPVAPSDDPMPDYAPPASAALPAGDR